MADRPFPALIDPFNRQIRYLRISVTDRCNYRCFYCMPSNGMEWEDRTEFLTYEELTRLVRLFCELGVDRVRLTGGEPLVRRGLVDFVRGLRGTHGLAEIALSTNAHLLADNAQALAKAGISRVNISLDSLKPDVFRQITRNGDLSPVLAGIDAAIQHGLRPVKLNMVVMKGLNDAEIVPMVDFAVRKQVSLRFIETMPIGEAGIDGTDYYLPADVILERLRAHYGSDLIPVPTDIGAGPARYYQIGGGSVRVGVISAMSQHFCDGCNRVRLTAKGDLVLCLGQEDRVSLREPLRHGLDDAQMKQTILSAIASKPFSHEFNSDPSKVANRNMSALGG